MKVIIDADACPVADITVSTAKERGHECIIVCDNTHSIEKDGAKTIVVDKAQTLPLPDMYGKNLIFKTGGVDGCDCDEILSLIAEGKIDTTPLITHKIALKDIEKAYDIFENKLDGVIKITIINE